VNATTLAKLLQEVQQLADAVRDAHAERLEESGLTALDRRLLGLLETAGRPVTTHRVARRLLRPESEVDAHLRALRQRGWIAAATASGRHGNALELCPAGRRQLEASRRAERELEAALERDLDAARMRATVLLLRAVRGRLQGARQRPGRAGRRGTAVAAEPDRPRRALRGCAEFERAAGA
jgi:hypothetical protein